MFRFYAVVFLSMLMTAGLVAAEEVIMDPDIDGEVAAVAGDPAAREALESECIALLSADTPYPELFRAFRILTAIGSERSIEPLAALLENEDTAHFARHALEVMPYDEAGQALCDALASTSGETRVGIMSSLAARREAAATPALKALLTEDDIETAETAAYALGHIATDEAVEALTSAADSGVPEKRLAAQKGLLTAAQHRGGAASADIYQALLTPDTPGFIRAGAFTGLLEAEPNQALTRVLDAVQAPDELLQLTAIAALTTLDDDAVPEQLVAVLPTLPVERQALILQALSERDDPDVLPVLHDAIGSESGEVRLAAMRAIAIHGDASSIEPLCQVLETTDNRQERMAAVETLRRLQGDDVNAALITRLESAPLAIRGALMETLAGRNAVDAVDAIMAQTEHSELRVAAFRALGHLAPPERLPELLALLGDLEDDTGRADAESAVVAVCQQMTQAEGQLEIVKAEYGVLPDGPSADVTDIVAGKIENGALVVNASNAVFGDPAPNAVKQLRVDYKQNGASATKTVNENRTLTLHARALSPTAVAMLSDALETAVSADEEVSLVRILSRLGGTDAYQLVVARVDAADSAVRDGAIRALANWPDAAAIDKLTEIFVATDASETAHRMETLRGCVRLLRQEELPPSEVLDVYARLVEAAQTDGERRLILAGLGDVSAAETVPLVMALLEGADVQAEADMALQRIEDATGMTAEEMEAVKQAAAQDPDEAFVPIFDGESLDGWAGDPAFWRVEDGHIIGETTEDDPLEYNTFLIWEDGVTADFDLRFNYKIESEWANSGVQIRSERFENYRVRGYQPDIATDDWITGICFEEQGRGILARRGQRAELHPDGEKTETRFEGEDELGAHINMHDWNTYRVVARGNRFMTFINGHKMHEIIDNAPEARAEGILAFQLHTGPPMKIRFSDIEIRHL